MKKFKNIKKKEKKAKHYRLLLSFTLQCVWVNNDFLTPFNFCYFIKFNNVTFFKNIFFNYMKKINYKKGKFNLKKKEKKTTHQTHKMELPDLSW
jgi:hypothetical protein